MDEASDVILTLDQECQARDSNISKSFIGNDLDYNNYCLNANIYHIIGICCLSLALVSVKKLQMKIINNYCFVSTIMPTSINKYTYMYQQLYILSDCLCKERNKNINNYICYSILYSMLSY